MHGYVYRHGLRLIELSAELDDDRGPARARRYDFNFKSRPSATGRGLEGPAIMTLTEFDTTLRMRRPGQAAITLRGTRHDPLDELPVASVVGAVYTEDDVTARCRAVATVQEEQFLPFHYGRTTGSRSIRRRRVRSRRRFAIPCRP